MMPKVLVGTPIFVDKEYIRRKFIQNVKSFTYPNFDFILVDNTQGLDYYRKLKREGLCKVFHTERGRNSREALANSQNFIREYALKNGYDYWMSVESDVLPPKDIIEKLIGHMKPLVGAMYYIGFDNVTPEQEKAGGIKKTGCVFYKTKTEIGGGTRIATPEESLKLEHTGLQKVHGLGLGCTLIRRDVLHQFKFWYDHRFDNKHSDVYFYMQLDNAHIPAYLDSDIVVQHWPSRWESVLDI